LFVGKLSVNDRMNRFAHRGQRQFIRVIHVAKPPPQQMKPTTITKTPRMPNTTRGKLLPYAKSGAPNTANDRRPPRKNWK
jgi:hypothetical protein